MARALQPRFQSRGRRPGQRLSDFHHTGRDPADRSADVGAAANRLPRLARRAAASASSRVLIARSTAAEGPGSVAFRFAPASATSAPKGRLFDRLRRSVFSSRSRARNVCFAPRSPARLAGVRTARAVAGQAAAARKSRAAGRSPRLTPVAGEQSVEPIRRAGRRLCLATRSING